ncbi:MAG: hypothetical protein H6780_02410 [Candidatus Nomurabacteria bacterium]|nr:MAG: hypothetical protein H6780_02410 [Candidatus Nomurabacteria bacterium]
MTRLLLILLIIVGGGALTLIIDSGIGVNFDEYSSLQNIIHRVAYMMYGAATAWAIWWKK